MKKIIGYIVIFTLMVGAVCGIVFGIKWCVAQNKLEKYAYLETILDDYDETIKSLREDKASLTLELNAVETENESYKELIVTLQTELSEKEELLLQYETQLDSDSETISDLEDEISNLKLEISSLETKISENEQTISDLEDEILSLQNEITRLTGLLDGYEAIANETFEVDFYVGKTLWTTKVVRSGNVVTGVETPFDTDTYIFVGWSLNGETIVDISEIEITSNTVFYAVLMYYKVVRFVGIDGELVSTQYVEIGECAEEPIYSVSSCYTVSGWSLNGEDVVDVSTYVITEDTEFVLIYEYNYITYTSLSQDVYSLEAGMYNFEEGYSFSWSYLLSAGYVTVDNGGITFSANFRAALFAMGGPVYLIFPTDVIYLGSECFSDVYSSSYVLNLVFTSETIEFAGDVGLQYKVNIYIKSDKVVLNAGCFENLSSDVILEIHAKEIVCYGNLFNESNGQILIIECPYVVDFVDSINKVWSNSMVVYVAADLLEEYVSTYKNSEWYGSYVFADISTLNLYKEL